MVRARFRLAGKNFLLTYSQCPIPKGDMLAYLRKLPFSVPLESVIVSLEHHQDTNEHIHVLIEFKQTYSCTNPLAFNVVHRGEHYHPNIKVANGRQRIIEYITKEDKAPATHNFDLDTYTKAKKGHRKYLAEKLVTGEITLIQAVQEEPSLVFQYASLKKSYELFRADLSRKDPPPRYSGPLPNTWGLELSIGSHAKQRHIWIWSLVPDKGKTTFLLSLRDLGVRGQFFNQMEHFQDQITPDHDAVFFDEPIPGRIKHQQLNSICDGTYQFPWKGAGAVTLSFPTVIVCANVPPHHYFSQAGHTEMALIYARFKVYDITNSVLEDSI